MRGIAVRVTRVGIQGIITSSKKSVFSDTAAGGNQKRTGERRVSASYSPVYWATHGFLRVFHSVSSIAILGCTLHQAPTQSNFASAPVHSKNPTSADHVLSGTGPSGLSCCTKLCHFYLPLAFLPRPYCVFAFGLPHHGARNGSKLPSVCVLKKIARRSAIFFALPLLCFCERVSLQGWFYLHCSLDQSPEHSRLREWNHR